MSERLCQCNVDFPKWPFQIGWLPLQTNPMKPLLLLCLSLFASVLALTTPAQDSYEIQVYASETVPTGKTMVELHSNFTVNGQEREVNGVFPSEHAFHETLEITHGFTSWFETGFYVFTSIQPHHGWRWVGDHIRPRVRVPDSWDCPVGLSLSTEIGYMDRSFTEDTWTGEIRPIIDKQFGPLYLALNPAFEKSLHGAHSSEPFEFAPSAKVSFDVTKVIALGVEYYSSLVTRLGVQLRRRFRPESQH